MEFWDILQKELGAEKFMPLFTPGKSFPRQNIAVQVINAAWLAWYIQGDLHPCIGKRAAERRVQPAGADRCAVFGKFPADLEAIFILLSSFPG